MVAITKIQKVKLPGKSRSAVIEMANNSFLTSADIFSRKILVKDIQHIRKKLWERSSS